VKNQPVLVFEDTLAQSAFYFENPIAEIKVLHIEELNSAFERMEQLRQSGHYLAGVVCYEVGMIFFPMDPLKIKTPPTPWLHFFAFKEKKSGWPAQFLSSSGSTSAPVVFDFKTDTTDQEYYDQQQILREHLLEGDIYQQNQTYQKCFKSELKAHDLYLELRQLQKTQYSAFLEFPDYSVLSFSPELFYKKKGSQLLTEPMKGTLSLDQDITKLTSDEKSIAENLMIVDLLRNDLGKIAEAGSVCVEKLFEVQKLSTVYQMVSRISATVDPEITFKEVLSHLFPCGSITGAPKWSAMEQIHRHENSPRGVYTGAIGVIEPNNDHCFNVAIRTLIQKNHGFNLGVGGGIVADSNVVDELEETRLKGRFVRKINQHFHLFETLLFDGENFRNLKAHRERIAQSAKFYDFEINWSELEDLLKITQNKLQGEHKIKLMLFWDGHWKVEHQPLEKTPQNPKMTLSSQPVDSKSHFQAHKTSFRALYDQEWKRAQQLGIYDFLFLNQNTEVVECSRHNIFIKKDQSWWTPPLSSGALPGVERQRALLELQAQQKILFLHDIIDADQIVLTNSVRGRVPVVWTSL
jgi:para-aminobenzoate synthetase/4-amino-4-deoxychorismate lyase